MRFDKITVEVREKVRHLFKFIALAGVIAAVLAIASMYMSSEVKRLEGVNGQYDTALTQLKTLNSSIEASVASINSNSMQITKDFMTKEEFIAFAGTASKATGCDIIRLSGGDPVSDGSVQKINFCFEVKGTITELYKFMERIEGLNCRYMLNNISMRKTEGFTWLGREDLDSFNLDWWDIETDNSSDSESKDEVITLDDIFGSNEMTLYLDLDFVTSEGVQ